MASNLLLRAFLLLCIVAYASSCKHAKYWKLKLPNVPLPKAVEANLLHSHPDDRWKPRETVNTWWYKQNNHDKNFVDQPYTIGLRFYNDDNNIGKYSSINTWYKSYNCSKVERHIINVDHLESNNKNDDENGVDDEVGALLFFTEQKLRVGEKQMHDFQKNGKVGFLARDVVVKLSIPFGGVDKLSQILKLLGYKPDSVEANAIKDTLTTCEKETSTTCTQSLEEIIDYVIQKLGTHNVKLSMMNKAEEVPTGLHSYTITAVHKHQVPGNSVVACHRMTYPYAVHQCHHLKDMGQYSVTLVNSEGVTVNTTAVCHFGPGAAWSPNFNIFKYLKVRPGEAPVCHFTAINDMFWLIDDNGGGLVSSVGENNGVTNRKIKLETIK